MLSDSAYKITSTQDLFERKRASASTFPFAMVVSIGLHKDKKVTQGGLEVRQLERVDDGIDECISKMRFDGGGKCSHLIISNMTVVLSEQG